MKAAARRRGLLENLKKLKGNKQVTFFRKKPGRGKGNGKQKEDLSDIVKIDIGIMVPDSGHLKRVRGKSLTVKSRENITASMKLKAHEKDILTGQIL